MAKATDVSFSHSSMDPIGTRLSVPRQNKGSSTKNAPTSLQTSNDHRLADQVDIEGAREYLRDCGCDYGLRRKTKALLRKGGRLRQEAPPGGSRQRSCL